MKKFSNSDVTVIIPTFNEEEGIGPTLNDLKQALKDPCFLLIDGNSMDRTVEIASKMGAKVIMQSETGKGQAIAQALEHINSGALYVVFIDGDFTYPARHIPEMIGILERNPNVGMVTGNRFNGSFSLKEAMHSVNYLGNKIINLVHHLLNGTKLEDPLTGLRVIRWEIIRKWSPISKGFDIEVELNYHVHKKGYRIIETPIEYRPRLGERKLKWRHGFKIMKRIIFQRLT